MPQGQKTRENRLRRMARRQLLRISKSRARDEFSATFGQYRLTDERDVVVLSGSNDTALDDIEAYLNDQTRPRWFVARDGSVSWGPATAPTWAP